jgi:hypothetical protein
VGKVYRAGRDSRAVAELSAMCHTTSNLGNALRDEVRAGREE